MTTFTPVPIGDGTFCYSGPNCRKHGQNKEENNRWFDNIKDVFSKAEEGFAPQVEEHPAYGQQEFHALAKQHWGMLTPNEKIAILEYADRSGSIRVNGTLSLPNMPENPNDLPYPDLVERINSLDSAIAKVEPVAARPLYRGEAKIRDEYQDLMPGDTITMKRYTSTSAAPSLAASFTEGRAHSLIIKIISEKGLAINSDSEEQEFLLPRNETYRVQSFNRNTTLLTSNPGFRPGDIGKPREFEGVSVLTLVCSDS